ncbi:hypothetical protein G6F57_017358 [Rhizopus arrhizus]|nr:hypothetical protein G6F57_017358 [Rhizopus arrhizus]
MPRIHCMSAPAEKEAPWPATTTARTASSRPAASSAAVSRAIRLASKALCSSGRFSQRVRTAPRRSICKASFMGFQGHSIPVWIIAGHWSWAMTRRGNVRIENHLHPAEITLDDAVRTAAAHLGRGRVRAGPACQRCDRPSPARTGLRQGRGSAPGGQGPGGRGAAAGAGRVHPVRAAHQRSQARRGRRRQPGTTCMTATASTAPLRVALVGNPNSGKTALFNQLTGSRQKVANYTGVTVERKEGRLRAPRPAWTRRSPATCAVASTRAKPRRTCCCA